MIIKLTAENLDDIENENNCKLKYSIPKNVIDENVGEYIFEIEEDTGIIRTARCCLDRERYPDYRIQVAATNSDGLKGVADVQITIDDVNDSPPRFLWDEFLIEVDETDGNLLPEAPILTAVIGDEDIFNEFNYKVIESSGFGADKFSMVRNSYDGTGSLMIVQPLDFEDPLQRNGFRFKIQVKDNGDDNNEDDYHTAYTWVTVKLRDINDNDPVFKDSLIETELWEDSQIGKTVARFYASDADGEGTSQVTYTIDRSSDRNRNFAINDGLVSIQRKLDRESMPTHEVKILATDDGNPSRTTSAFLKVIVKDRNDNAPKLLKNYQRVVPEHSAPRKIVEVLAIDDDEWQRGNGPPFTFRMDPNASDVIRKHFKVEHVPSM